MIHFAICDDKKAVLSDLEREVGDWAGEKKETYSVELYTSADAFLFAWEERKDTDVLLLDIEMPGMDGIALARKLRGMGERISIIFVTGNPDFALEGYDLEAVSYIVKPLKRERLWAALDRAGEHMRRREALIVPLSGGEMERVYVSDVCYLESDGHGTIVWKRDGSRLMCKAGIQQLEQELEENKDNFFKPHRSYLIHLDCVERISRKDVQMENQAFVPVARGKWEALNQAYLQYFRRKSF